MEIPQQVPGVPDEVLNPRNTSYDQSAYDKQAADLARRFVQNFKKYEEGTSNWIKNARAKKCNTSRATGLIE